MEGLVGMSVLLRRLLRILLLPDKFSMLTIGVSNARDLLEGSEGQ